MVMHLSFRQLIDIELSWTEIKFKKKVDLIFGQNFLNNVLRILKNVVNLSELKDNGW